MMLDTDHAPAGDTIFADLRGKTLRLGRRHWGLQRFVERFLLKFDVLTVFRSEKLT